MIPLKIQSFRNVGLKTICDISVEDNHSYITRGGIISHNTTNPDIKPMFIAPPGYALVELDYSQAELRIVAELAKEEAMIESFKSGHNIHVAVAAKMNKVSYEYAYPITKDENHPLHDEWTKKKKKAKTINFGILYEQGPAKLAEGLKSTKEEAIEFRNEWLETFPRIAKWIDKQHKYARKHGYVYNMWGFKRRLPNIYSSNKGIAMEAERQSVNCVDDLTEALTLAGWKKYNELKPGEIILTKNPNNGHLEWQPIKNLNIYPDYQGEAYLIENKRKTFSALTTPNHRWLGNPSSKRLNRDKVYTSEELYKDPPRVIHRTGEYIFPDTSTYSNDLIEFIGWVLTDGGLRYYNLPGKPRNGQPHMVTLTQSYRANHSKVKIIEDLLDRLKFTYRKLNIIETGSYRWVFNKEVADLLHKIIPYKKINMGLITSLTREQATILVNAMMLGDGSGGRRLVSGDIGNAGLFQVILTLLGKSSNIVARDCIGQKHYGNVRNKDGYVEIKNPSYRVSILKRDKAHTKSTRGDSYIKKIPNYSGVMWCPTVDNGFWVARRNSTVYITGNSPIQGAASFFTLFSAIVIEELRLQGRIPLDFPLVSTVHDSIEYYVRLDKIHEFASIAIPVMANPQTKEFFGFQMKYVNMKASMELGLDWGHMHEYDKNFDYTQWDSTKQI